MRFLLDENLSPKLVQLLGGHGHDAVHVRDIGLVSASDEVVIAAASADDRILISADTTESRRLRYPDGVERLNSSRSGAVGTLINHPMRNTGVGHSPRRSSL
jgi:Uncharacterized protein conserved in bacteria